MFKIPEEIKLVNPTDDKEITFSFSRLNGNKYSKLADLEATFRNTKKEANLLFMMTKSNPDAIKSTMDNSSFEQLEPIIDQIKSGKITVNEVAELFEQASPDIYKNNLKRKIEIVKLMLDEKKLTEEQSKMIENDEFWLYQDILLIEETANSFRSVLR